MSVTVATLFSVILMMLILRVILCAFAVGAVLPLCAVLLVGAGLRLYAAGLLVIEIVHSHFLLPTWIYIQYAPKDGGLYVRTAVFGKVVCVKHMVHDKPRPIIIIP